MGKGFRELRVYREAVRLADDLRRIVLIWDSFDRWTIGIQLVRSADSIGANIAEAYGRWQPADQRRLLFIARGSAWETEHWLHSAIGRDLVSDGEFERRIAEIGRMLNGLIRAHSDASLATGN